MIDKSVTLLGAQAGVDPRTAAGLRTVGSSDESIIDGRTTDADGNVTTLKNLIRIAADDVVIDGFDVGHGTGDLIESTDPIANPVLRYNLVHDSSGDEGVQIRKASDAVIEYNHVLDIAQDGINLSSSSTDGTIRFNEVHDSDSDNAAIYVYGATNTTIQGNLVYNVTDNDGIKLGSGGSGDAKHDKVGGTIIDNVVYDTVQDGITVYMSNVTVSGNDVSASTSENGALYISQNVTGVAITDNTFHDNGTATDDAVTFAIRVGKNNYKPTEVTITDNTFTNNEAQIYMQDGSVANDDTLAADNTFDNDASAGVTHLVGPAGTPGADHPTIQAAVNEANPGDIILIAAGTYTESVTVDKAVSFVGLGADRTIISPASGSAFVLSGDLGAAGTVSFDSIGFVGAAHSGIQLGDAGQGAAADVTLGTLEISNSSFEQNAVNGLHLHNSDSLTPNTNVGNVIVTDTSFVENGRPGTSSGDGDIMLYQFNGDATLRNLTVDGGTRTIGDGSSDDIGTDKAGENGIQFRGDSGSLGTVTIDNVTVAGNYEKVAVAFYNYDDVNGLTLADVGITAETGWDLSYNFDGIGGAIDLSQFSGLIYSERAALQDEKGAGTDNAFTGTDQNDLFRPRGGNDVIDGRGGTDTLDYDGEPAGVTINMATGTATDGSGGTDTFSNIENATGSDHADTLIGDAGDNVLSGDSGDDTLEGGAGDDELLGDGKLLGYERPFDDTGTTSDPYGDASFRLTARGFYEGKRVFSFDNPSAETVSVDYTLYQTSITGTFAAAANSRTYFLVDDPDPNGPGTTIVDFIDATGATPVQRSFTKAHGGNFPDHLTPPIYEGTGDDTFVWRIGDGSDTVDGGNGTDHFMAKGDGTASAFTITPDGDTVEFAVDEDNDGTVDATSVLSNVERITLDGFAGADSITISGDFRNTGLAADGLTVNAGDGGTTVDASGITSAHSVTMNGGAGDDTFTGGAGVDTLIGAGGDDTLSGGKGVETIDGGAGSDTASYVFDTAGVSVDLDRQRATDGWGDRDTLVSIENATGSEFADTLEGDDGANVLTGLGGDDTIDGGAGNDVIDAGGGDDIIDWAIGDGSDTIDGGAATDVLRIEGDNTNNTITITAGVGSLDVTVDGVTSTVTNVDKIEIDTRNGDDTVTVVGDFTGTGLSASGIQVRNGQQTIVVDAAQLTSANTSTQKAGPGTTASPAVPGTIDSSRREATIRWSATVAMTRSPETTATTR